MRTRLEKSRLGLIPRTILFFFLLLSHISMGGTRPSLQTRFTSPQPGVVTWFLSSFGAGANAVSVFQNDEIWLGGFYFFDKGSQLWMIGCLDSKGFPRLSFGKEGLLITPLQHFENHDFVEGGTKVSLGGSIESLSIQPNQSGVVIAGFASERNLLLDINLAVGQISQNEVWDQEFAKGGVKIERNHGKSLATSTLALPDSSILVAGSAMINKRQSAVLIRYVKQGTKWQATPLVTKALPSPLTQSIWQHLVFDEKNKKVFAIGKASSTDGAESKGLVGQFDLDILDVGAVWSEPTISYSLLDHPKNYLLDPMVGIIAEGGKIMILGNASSKATGTKENFFINFDPLHDLATQQVSPLKLGENFVIEGAALSKNGKVIIAGNAGPLKEEVHGRGFVTQLSFDGTLDLEFGAQGITFLTLPETDIAISAVATQSDGKIISAGSAGRPKKIFVSRLLPNGKADETFAK